MCGIFGHISPGKPVEVLDCRRAIEALAHRGPDGLGVALGRLEDRSATFHLNPHGGRLRALSADRCDFFLGHRRLSVIDLAEEAFQPMSNEDGVVWVVFNGEIYNHQELRRRLEGLGHRFRTDHSDTEVLVHGYEQWGQRLVDELRGMFAFAVLDLRTRRLTMARDRFGEKPLYYRTDGKGVTFASELKALLHLPEVDLTISPEALVDYLHHRVVPAPRCIYRGMRKLRAAEIVTIELDAPDVCHSEIYWSVDYDPAPGKSDARWFDEFEAELRESIRLRSISDVPLGTFLSGGLDSTIVVRQLSRIARRPVSTFSIGFAEEQFDESRWAARAARHFGTAHHRRVVSSQDLLDVVAEVAEMFDEPFADPSAIPTLLVSRLAREHVTVALTGDGGDELLAGYARYARCHRLGRWFDRGPGRLAKSLLRPVASLWPESARGKALLRLLVRGTKERYFRSFMDDYLLGQLDPGPAENWHCLLDSAWSEDTSNLVDRMCAMDRQFYIPEDLAVKVDRTSMSVSLEARAPLLDHKLFELVARMPLATRFDGREGKLPFRRILSRELGEDFVDRPKQGFAIPLGRWFRGRLRDQLNDTLLQSGGIVTSLFSRGGVEKLIDNHCRGSRDQSERLWKLYILQKWNDCYGKRQSQDRVADMPVIRAA